MITSKALRAWSKPPMRHTAASRATPRLSEPSACKHHVVFPLQYTDLARATGSTGVRNVYSNGRFSRQRGGAISDWFRSQVALTGRGHASARDGQVVENGWSTYTFVTQRRRGDMPRARRQYGVVGHATGLHIRGGNNAEHAAVCGTGIYGNGIQYLQGARRSDMANHMRLHLVLQSQSHRGDRGPAAWLLYLAHSARHWLRPMQHNEDHQHG
jgi:hypothetical protein